MEELEIISLLGIGLGLACLLGYTASKIGQSPIIGYLVAGYIIGPNSPGPAVDMYISKQLASIGITLIMFSVGLSFNWKDIIAVKNIVLPGALCVSLLTILFGTLYSAYLGEPYLSGLVIGIAICVSSTVVVIRALTDQGILHSQEGHIIVGWTIVEDLISISGLLLLPALVLSKISNEQQTLNILQPIFWVLFKTMILGFFIYFFGEKIMAKIFRLIGKEKSHELLTIAILSSVFLIAVGTTYLFGVSLALGAFIAGTVVGKTSMSHLAATRASAMRDTFAVIFFLSVGMLLNPLTILSNYPLFLGVLFAVLLFRPFLAFLYVKIAKYPTHAALTLALANAQIGEYSFILAQEGSFLNILPNNAYDILVATAFISIGFNSLLFKCFKTCSKSSTG